MVSVAGLNAKLFISTEYVFGLLVLFSLLFVLVLSILSGTLMTPLFPSSASLSFALFENTAIPATINPITTKIIIIIPNVFIFILPPYNFLTYIYLCCLFLIYFFIINRHFCLISFLILSISLNFSDIDS